MKTCRVCGQTDVARFRFSASRKLDGKKWQHGKCRDCENAQTQRRRKARYDPAKRRAAHLRQLYGITVAVYDAMLEAQGGVCALCKQPSTVYGRYSKLHVDHDHTTGRVRGLLCDNCNRRLLPEVERDPAILQRLAAYINK